MHATLMGDDVRQFLEQLRQRCVHFATENPSSSSIRAHSAEFAAHFRPISHRRFSSTTCDLINATLGHTTLHIGGPAHTKEQHHG